MSDEHLGRGRDTPSPCLLWRGDGPCPLLCLRLPMAALAIPRTLGALALGRRVSVVLLAVLHPRWGRFERGKCCGWLWRGRRLDPDAERGELHQDRCGGLLGGEGRYFLFQGCKLAGIQANGEGAVFLSFIDVHQINDAARAALMAAVGNSVKSAALFDRKMDGCRAIARAALVHAPLGSAFCRGLSHTHASSARGKSVTSATSILRMCLVCKQRWRV